MIKKVSSQQLKTGMFVCGNDRNWLETPFFRSKFLITSDKQIKELQEYCGTVYIDTEKGLDVRDRDSSSDGGNPQQQIYFDCIKRLNSASTLDSAARKQAALTIVRDLYAGLQQYYDALLNLSWQTGHSDTIGDRAVDTCLQTLALGKHLLLTQENLLNLGLSTLLHGIRSTFGLSEEIAHRSINPTSAPTSEPFQAAIDIASTFNTLRHEQPSYSPWPEAEALRHMVNDKQSSFDGGLLAHFIDTLGLYPLHCIVELNTGELAYVREIDQQAPNRPTLQLLSNSHKQLVGNESILKLSNPSAKRYRIVRTLPTDDPLIAVLKLHNAQFISWSPQT
ncbi:MAG: DUF3391 domain-containing protein [Gammaproteobacteria bacterium]